MNGSPFSTRYKRSAGVRMSDYTRHSNRIPRNLKRSHCFFFVEFWCVHVLQRISLGCTVRTKPPPSWLHRKTSSLHFVPLQVELVSSYVSPLQLQETSPEKLPHQIIMIPTPKLKMYQMLFAPARRQQCTKCSVEWPLCAHSLLTNRSQCLGQYTTLSSLRIGTKSAAR